MSLRAKTFVTIATILVFMILIICASTRWIILSGFSNLEKQSILRSTDQAVKMFKDEQNHIASIVGDWAPWNDTYDFVQNGNQEYIDDNLNDDTILNLSVDFLLFLNTDQQVVYCKYIDPETEEGASCPDSLLRYIATDSFVQQTKNIEEDIVKGFDLLPEQPFLIAFAPILTSHFKGPSTGTLVAGRLLTKTEIERLASNVNLSISLQRFTDDQQLPKALTTVKELLSPDKGIRIFVKDEDTLAAYVLLKDLNGTPVLMLGIDEKRLVMAQGKKSLTYFIIAITLTALLFLVVTLLFLETKILSKISQLNREVKVIGKTGDFLQKTTLTGNDELANLSSEINQMVESLRISTERDRAILESIADGYFELDLNGLLTFYNRSFIRLVSPAQQNILGMSYRNLLDRSSAVKTIKAFQRLHDTKKPIKDFETGLILDSGEQRYFESTISVITDKSGQITGFRGITRDVTEKKEAAQELTYMVYHDSLTGLLNRKALYDNLGQELSYADRYSQERSLLFIDLDGFKSVNDTYGHGVGDAFLIAFAKRLQQTARETDHIYRLGGDEFAVILSNPSEQNPGTIAQRIVDMMQQPFLVNDIEINFVTTSIGVSIFPLNGKDPDRLLQLADSRMYEAKKTKNSFSVATPE